MRILIMIGAFKPAIKYGGPVTSIVNMCQQLSKELEFFVVTLDHDLKSKERFSNITEGWNYTKTEKILYLKDSEVKYRTILRIIKEINPDLVYLNSLYLAKFAIPSFIICDNKNIPLLLAPRGELGMNGYRPKQIKKKLYISLYRRLYGIRNRFWLHATSNEEVAQYKALLGTDESKIVVVKNIPSMPSGCLPKKEKISGTLNCIFMSRIHEHKNLDFAIKILSRLHGNVNFDIYGPIENIQYWEKCEQLINGLSSNVSVKYKGIISRENINIIFSNYDLFFCPTRSENFGHSIVESMLCRCPVVISDQTPWTDINDNKAGWALSLLHEEPFINILQDLVDMNNQEYCKLAERAHSYITEKIDINGIKTSYIDAFKKIINVENESKKAI